MPRKKSLVGPTSPSAYAVTSLRSSFGKQCQSGVASSPGASFGSARRDDFDRTYAGRDADRCASYFMSTLVMLIGADDRPVRGMALSGRAEPIGSSLLCAGRGCGLLARVPGWDTTTKHIPPSGR